MACQPRPKARTTVPAADLAGRPDLVKRDFTADAPARKPDGCHHLYSHPGRVRVPGMPSQGCQLDKGLLATP